MKILFSFIVGTLSLFENQWGNFALIASIGFSCYIAANKITEFLYDKSSLVTSRTGRMLHRSMKLIIAIVQVLIIALVIDVFLTITAFIKVAYL